MSVEPMSMPPGPSKYGSSIVVDLFMNSRAPCRQRLYSKQQPTSMSQLTSWRPISFWLPPCDLISCSACAFVMIRGNPCDQPAPWMRVVT